MKQATAKARWFIALYLKVFRLAGKWINLVWTQDATKGSYNVMTSQPSKAAMTSKAITPTKRPIAARSLSAMMSIIRYNMTLSSLTREKTQKGCRLLQCWRDRQRLPEVKGVAHHCVTTLGAVKFVCLPTFIDSLPSPPNFFGFAAE